MRVKRATPKSTRPALARWTIAVYSPREDDRPAGSGHRSGGVSGTIAGLRKMSVEDIEDRFRADLHLAKTTARADQGRVVVDLDVRGRGLRPRSASLDFPHVREADITRTSVGRLVDLIETRKGVSSFREKVPE